MEELEPNKKIKIFSKEFIAKYVYVIVLGIILIGGISYGYTFFTQNKKIASGSITTAALTVNFTDRSISASSLSVPVDNQEGLSEYTKSLTITNTTATDGIVKLTLTRTSGLNLTDMSYAIVVNGAIQEIGDVPSNGEILETAIMGNETINVELRLWPKTSYSGSTTTFVGELTPEIRYLGKTAVDSIDSPAGKYVNFNCNNGTCEKWQIVKVEDDRLVLTRQTDYTNAVSRTNSGTFDSTLGLHDDGNLITSVSTDGKNVYLAQTVKIVDGDGTQNNPFVLENTIWHELDKKAIANINYYDEDSGYNGEQSVYYNETNYISQTIDNPDFIGWSDGTNTYQLGDVVTTTSNMSLVAIVNNLTINFVNECDQDEMLEDAVIEIYGDSNLNDFIMEITSTDSPLVISLPPGTYYIVNTLAPVGYNLVPTTLEKIVNIGNSNEWFIGFYPGTTDPLADPYTCANNNPSTPEPTLPQRTPALNTPTPLAP